MRKALIALSAVGAFSLAACGGAQDDNYDNYYPETEQTPTAEPSDTTQTTVKIDTYGGQDAGHVTKFDVDGVPCVVFSSYDGGSGISCDWKDYE